MPLFFSFFFFFFSLSLSLPPSLFLPLLVTQATLSALKDNIQALTAQWSHLQQAQLRVAQAVSQESLNGGSQMGA